MTTKTDTKRNAKSGIELPPSVETFNRRERRTRRTNVKTAILRIDDIRNADELLYRRLVNGGLPVGSPMGPIGWWVLCMDHNEATGCRTGAEAQSAATFPTWCRKCSAVYRRYLTDRGEL